jgi:hypothetical protein
LPTYVAGNNPEKAVLYVHDALGWQFKNARLLADHYAKEVRLSRLSSFLLFRSTRAACSTHLASDLAPSLPPLTDP